MPEPLPRQVVREHLFEETLSALISGRRRADEFVEAAEFALARNPEFGSPLDRARKVWFVPRSPVGVKQVSLYYSFDDETVRFLAIMRVPAPE
jgi:hypothetical protein